MQLHLFRVSWNFGTFFPRLGCRHESRREMRRGGGFLMPAKAKRPGAVPAFSRRYFLVIANEATCPPKPEGRRWKRSGAVFGTLDCFLAKTLLAMTERATPPLAPATSGNPCSPSRRRHRAWRGRAR